MPTAHATGQTGRVERRRAESGGASQGGEGGAAGLPPTAELERAALQLLMTDGLSGLTFGRLSRATGVSDRMLVYRFGTKAALMERTLDMLSAGLRDQLSATLGRLGSAAELLPRASEALTLPEHRPMLAVWFEVLAGAARGDPAPAEAARQIAAGWHAWLVEVLAAEPDPVKAASRVLARLEGVLVLHVAGLEDHARTAAGV